MKITPSTNPLIKIIVFCILTLALLTGCSRLELNVLLQPDEPVAVRQPVLLDGREVGKVCDIREDGASRFAVLRITDRAARNAMRVGVEREQRGAEMRLSSANAKNDAPPLENGALIPTRTPAQNAATRGFDNIERILWAIHDYIADHELAAIGGLLLAAIILVALLRAAFGRGCRSSTWLLAFALALSATTAAAADSGILFTRERLRDDLNVVQHCLTEAERNSDAAARLLDASLIREAADEMVRGLFRLDAADVRLEGFPDRVANLKKSPFAYSHGEEQKRLSAAHATLRRELQAATQRAGALRQRFPSTNTREATTLAVYVAKRDSFRNRARNGSIAPDTVLEECHLLAPFGLHIVTSGIVNKENAAQCRINPDGTVTLPNGQTLLPDGKPEPHVNPTDEQARAAIARLQQSSQKLQEELDRLSRAQNSTKRSPPVPTVVTNYHVVTNEVRTVAMVEKPVTNTIVQTNIVHDVVERLVPVVVYRTNQLVITNIEKIFIDRPVKATTNSPPPAALPPESGRSGAVSRVPADRVPESNAIPSTGTTTNNSATTGPAKEPPTPPAAPTPQTPGPSEQAVSPLVIKAVIAVAIAVLLIALLVYGFIASARRGPAKVELADAGTSESQEVILTGSTDILVLDEAPHPAPKNLRGGNAAITRDWLGRALLLAGEGTSVNGVIVHGECRLHPGDTVTLADSTRGKTWVFRGMTAVESLAFDPETNPIA